VRGIEIGDGAPIPDGGSGPLVRGASGIEEDAGAPIPGVDALPIRVVGNGPLVAGVISGPLPSLLAESRSGGSGWTGAFERGSAEVARPFITVWFT
jgi:hypothetical protein